MTELESKGVSNWVAAVIVAAAIVALVALAQGTPDHARDRGEAPRAVVATSMA